MHEIIKLYYEIPMSFWGFLGGSAFVSVLLQNVKHWLSLQSDRVIHLLQLVISFVTVAVGYLVSSHSQNPSVLALQTFLLTGGSTTIYRYFTKPASNILNDAKVERERRTAGTAPAIEPDQPVPTAADFAA